MRRAAGIDMGFASPCCTRALVVAGVMLLLTFDAQTAGAGCCQYIAGCLNDIDAATCEAELSGTFFPDPSTCSPGDPPTCSTGTSTTSTTTTTTTLVVDSTTTTTTVPGPGYPGFTDGRLNPDPAEYYAIWCAFDQVDVYRSVPQDELLKVIPLLDVISLSVGGALDLGDIMTLVRASSDVVTVYGSNGNDAPQPGSKSFSLGECIERNGGAPDAPDPPAGPKRGEPSSPEEESLWEAEAQRAREHREAVENCFDQYEFFGDVSFLLDCLDFVGGIYAGIEQCWVPIFRFLVSGTPGRSGGPLGAADGHRPVARRQAGDEAGTVQPRGTVPGSGGFDFLALYLQLTLLRDEVFAGTPGGRRATDLYEASNGALLQSAIGNPAVLTAGRAALDAWAPVVRGLIEGDGSAPAVSAAQVRAFENFLAEVRAGASPELGLALEREVLLLDPASFMGLTPAQMVERLDRLSCVAAPDFASLRCRLADVSRIVDTEIDRKVGKRLASKLAKAMKQAKRAEVAAEGTRRRRKALRRTERLLRRVEQRLGKKKVIASVPEKVRLVLGADVPALRLDARALAETAH